MDGFDGLPDSLIVFIFNLVLDVKTLIRCRAVSKRFNSLVPQAESLVLRVDCVIQSESDESSLISMLKSFIKSLQDLVSMAQRPSHHRVNSPTQILKQFERIRRLEIELPYGDLKLEKGTVVKYRAEYGKSLKSCVIVGFSGSAACDGELKRRVVWTISALLAASTRHYFMKELANEHRGLELLVVKDKEGEGTVVMDKRGLDEAYISEVAVVNRCRTTVPDVKMRMRQEAKDGVTMVVVRSTAEEGVAEDGELATAAFCGDEVFGDAVESLIKCRSYLLEMNSF